MGFFDDEPLTEPTRLKAGVPSLRLLHELGCKACPLNNAENAHPKMLPTGSPNPDIVFIGEAPGQNEDEEGRQFVGPSGQYLRKQIPQAWLPLIGWDNVLQCRPPKNRTPEHVEIECCRPRHALYIEQAKPGAVFGFGGIPLGWATGQQNISMWRGRYIPIRVGTHALWYFAFHHPSYLLRLRNSSGGFDELERMFSLDLKRAFKLYTELPEAHPHSKEEALSGVETFEHCTHEDAEKIVRFLDRAARHPLAGVDYETQGKRPYGEDAVILSVAISSNGSAIAFPIDHPDATWAPADLQMVVQAYLDFIRVPTVRKVAHNSTFELEWSGVVFGLEYVRASQWEDPMSQAFVLDQRTIKNAKEDDAGLIEAYSLGFLTHLHFGIDIKTLHSLNFKNMRSEPLRKILPYNGVDAKYAEALFLAQDKILKREGLLHVYDNHNRRIPTVTLTQIKGVPLDLDEADKLDKEYTEQIVKHTAAIQAQPVLKEFRQRTGTLFNPASNGDMAIMCRDVLKSKAGQRRDGKYKVDEDTLKQIKHPLIQPVLDLRGVTKLRSTYCFTRDSPVVWPDNMLHPSLNTVRAVTSRLSSSDPNEQNWPKRDEKAKEMRRQMAAWLDHLLASFDYAQIEARVFAMAAPEDRNYVNIWWQDYDIHGEWSRRIALAYPQRIGGKKFLDDKVVMKKLRDVVKGSWVFALFFGANLSTCAHYVGVPEEYLKPLENEFWKQFGGIKQWQDTQIEFYNDHGYVELLTGRRRYGPLTRNQVCNTPIQGSMAEIVLDAMNRISELDLWDIQPCWNIHDDLGFHFLAELIDEYAEIILAEMLRPTFDFINVPLVVEMSVGQNLFDMEEVGKFKSNDWYKYTQESGWKGVISA